MYVVKYHFKFECEVVILYKPIDIVPLMLYGFKSNFCPLVKAITRLKSSIAYLDVDNFPSSITDFCKKKIILHSIY